VDKTIRLSNPKFHQKNFELMINLLLNNCYSINFIFTTIKKRIKQIIFKNRNNIDKQTPQYCTIPFVKNLSNKISNILAKHNVKTSFYGNNKLNKFIKTHKDPLPASQKTHLVYQILRL